MSAKIRKITVFFKFFKIEMTFILGLRGLHGNKKFEIEGNFISRDRKKLHLFGHLLRNKIAEIITKIARKIEKLHGVLDNQNF